MNTRKFLGIAAAVVIFASAFSRQDSGKLQDGNCPSTPARLKQADIAVVTVPDGETLNLRVFPGLDQQIITKIPAYTYVTIIAGPICDSGYRWFEVGWEGKDGWSAEVGPDGEYNMIPNGSPMPTQEPESSSQPQTQQSDVWPDALIGVWKGNIECNTNMQIHACDVDVVVTRTSDGSLELSVTVDSELINSSSRQGVYKESWAKPGIWGYTFILDRKDFTSVAEIDPISDNKIYFWDFGQDSDGTSEFGDLTRVGEPAISPTPIPQPTQIPQNDPILQELGVVPTPEPTGIDWWVDKITKLFGGDTVLADKVRCEPQCMNEARSRRGDMAKWIPGTGNTIPMDVLTKALTSPTFPWQNQTMQVRVRDLSNPKDQPQVGDLIIWPESVLNNGTGHIGVVTAGGFHDSNWNLDCKPRDLALPSPIPSYLKFVTSPYLVDKCAKPVGWDILTCKLPWNK